MSIHPSTFEDIVYGRHITFTIPHSPPDTHRRLRVAVLDSPSGSTALSASDADDSTARIAAVWVPVGRESDWIFTTFSGHFHLMLSCPNSLSRLILISRSDSHDCAPCPLVRPNVAPLLFALTPKSAFLANGEIREVPFLVYEDGVHKNSILEICEGNFVGEMLIENVELDNRGTSVREFRRRLRFKRMPNLVQTQMRICPRNDVFCEGLNRLEFELDDDVLVHSYLSPMVAGISVISSYLDGRRPKALCLGVGGGALIGFLCKKLNFEVVGVEIDGVVVDVAKRYFGLESNESISLHVGDAIEFLRKAVNNGDGSRKFDVVMVDLDSCHPSSSFCAPPVEFVQDTVLRAAREVLCEFGVLIINTIPSSESSYVEMISMLQEIFEEVYDINVGNKENLVLIATKSRAHLVDVCHGSFAVKLEVLVPISYIESIRRIPKLDSPVIRRSTS